MPNNTLNQSFPPMSALRPLKRFRIALDAEDRELKGAAEKRLATVADFLRANNFIVVDEGEESDALLRIWLSGMELDAIGQPDKTTLFCIFELMTTVPSAPPSELFIVWRDAHGVLSAVSQLRDGLERIFMLRTAALVKRLNEAQQ